MAQQIINVGASANDQQGDPVRTSFQKTNANFTELYHNIVKRVYLDWWGKSLIRIVFVDTCGYAI